MQVWTIFLGTRGSCENVHFVKDSSKSVLPCLFEKPYLYFAWPYKTRANGILAIENWKTELLRWWYRCMVEIFNIWFLVFRYDQFYKQMRKSDKPLWTYLHGSVGQVYTLFLNPLLITLLQIGAFISCLEHATKTIFFLERSSLINEIYLFRRPCYT